ncbi:hypothetical protein, partial [Treponema sp. R80B11-R83G3]
MNIGTGGANISIDNLASAFKGLQTLDVNSKITNAGKNNNFGALTALRVQYGYGDSVQKEQFWDILNGNTLINTNAEGEYDTETTINEDGKRVINITGYKEGMGKEDQFLLGVMLGYEAYIDGYTAGEIDASGKIYTNQSKSFNIDVATMASDLMVERIIKENDWFGSVFEKFAFTDFIEKDMYDVSLFSNDDSLFNNDDSLEKFDPKGVMNFNVLTGDDYQNDYKGIPLFLSKTKATVDEINERRAWLAYVKYKQRSIKCEGNTFVEFERRYNIPHYYKDTYEKEFEEFKKNEKLL